MVTTCLKNPYAVLHTAHMDTDFRDFLGKACSIHMLRVQPSVCSPFYRVREPWEKESWWPDFVTYCLVLSIWYLKAP